MFRVPEKFRVRKGKLISDASYGNNGAFMIKAVQPIPGGQHIAYFFLCIASDGEGWEHVSVSVVHPEMSRTPSWEEMCAIKDIFWEPQDCVVQYHPPKDKYVNQHPFCLHLWRKIGFDMPVPNPDLVGMVKKPIIERIVNKIIGG